MGSVDWKNVFDKVLKLRSLASLKNERKTNDPTIMLLKKFMNDELKNLLFDCLKSRDVDVDKITIKPTVGIGNASECPWIRMSNIKTASSGVTGFYPAIIFNVEKNDIILCLCCTVEKYNNRDEPLKRAEEIKNNFLNKGLFLNWDYLKFKNYHMNENDQFNSRANKYMWGMIFCNIINISSFNNKNFEILLVDLIVNYLKYVYDSQNILGNYHLEVYDDISKKSDKITINLFDSSHLAAFVSQKKEKMSKVICREKNKKRIENNKIKGDNAEKVISEYEKMMLTSKGRPDLAEKVKIMSTDGDGYDVLSYYYENGEENI